MRQPRVDITAVEQSLLRFALGHEDEFCFTKEQLREAISRGSVEIPGKGTLSRESALLDILEVKERAIGTSTASESAFARKLCEKFLRSATIRRLKQAYPLAR